MPETDPNEQVEPAEIPAAPTSLDAETADALDLENMTDFEREIVAGFEAATFAPTDVEPVVSSDDGGALPGEESRAGTPPLGHEAEATSDPDPDPEQVANPVQADTIDFLGNKLTIEEAKELANVYEWVTNLTPEETQRVADALASPGATGPAPAPTPEPAPTTTEFDELTDPAVIERFQAMEAELAQLRAVAGTSQEAIAAQQRAEANAAIGRVRETFTEEHGLSPIEMEQLMARTYKSGIMNVLVSQYENPDQLFSAAFEQTLWTDPQFREKEIQRLSVQQDQETAAIQARNRQKASLAASLNGSSGSLPRVEPTPRDLTPEQRHLAMVEEVRAAQGG